MLAGASFSWSRLHHKFQATTTSRPRGLFLGGLHLQNSSTKLFSMDVKKKKMLRKCGPSLVGWRPVLLGVLIIVDSLFIHSVCS